MINLEQLKQLETKVVNAIDWIERLSDENAGLRNKETELQTRLETYQTRNDELEALIVRFKEDQGRMEDAILAALDRFNQFEEVIEKSMRDKPRGINASTKEPAKSKQITDNPPATIDADGSGGGKINFEIPLSSTETNGSMVRQGVKPESEINDDDLDPLSPLEEPLSPLESLDDTLEPLTITDSSPKKSGELDIF